MLQAGRGICAFHGVLLVDRAARYARRHLLDRVLLQARRQLWALGALIMYALRAAVSLGRWGI